FSRDWSSDVGSSDRGGGPCHGGGNRRQKRVHAARNQGGGHGAAQRKAAIHGQVGKTQQTEGNQDAQRDQAENQTDFQGAEQRKQGHGESGPARLVNAAGAAASVFSEKARRPAG